MATCVWTVAAIGVLKGDSRNCVRVARRSYYGGQGGVVQMERRLRNCTVSCVFSAITPKGDKIEFEKGSLLGAGFWGEVFEVISSSDHPPMAVKLVKLGSDGNLLNEVSLLSSLSHDNIVKYYGWGQDENYSYMLMEKAEGTLMNIYTKKKCEIPEISKISRQVCSALVYLHGRSIEHRDLYTDNLLVGLDGAIKIADFGLSCKVDITNLSSVGKDDVLSMGSIILWLFTTVGSDSRIRLSEIFENGEQLVRKFVPDEAARDFLIACLHSDPAVRPSSRDLMGHPFLKGIQ